jgi:hypothetical protein
VSENKDVPAQLRFAGDREEPVIQHGDDSFDLDNDVELEDEVEVPVKPRGMPGWIKGVIGVTLFTLVAGGGFVVVKVMEAKKKADQEVVYENPPPQPVIAAPAANPAVSPVPANAGQQGGPQGQSVSDPTKPLPSQPAASSEQMVPVSPVPASTQLIQPAAQTVQPPAQPAQPAQQVAVQAAPTPTKATDDPVLRAELAQAQKDALAAKKSIQDMETRIQSLESQIAKLTSSKMAAASAPASQVSKSTSQKQADTHSTATALPERVAAKPAPAPKVAPSARSTFAQKESFVQPDMPKASKVISSAVITGIIGNRAFIVRHAEDGKEIEVSVMPGDMFDGVKVISVSGSDREVGLADGRVIKTQSNLKN